MKRCSKCKQEKSKEMFFRNKSHTDGLHHECKECARSRRKKYGSYPCQRDPSYMQSYKKERRKRLSNWLTENKKECVYCGENDSVCLEFHHIDPSIKEASLSFAFREFSVVRIMEEINKCVILCANCHRKLHREKISLHDLTLTDRAKIGGFPATTGMQ